MHIHLIGGIYGMSDDFRSHKLQSTTETQLEHGLRELGHTVTTAPHRALRHISSQVDIVHVHHLARGAIQGVLNLQVPMIFTRHATKRLPLSHKLILMATLRRAEANIALSHREKLSLPSPIAEKTHVIYNGIDSRLFHPAEAPPEFAPECVFRMLYVGQVIALKRVHLAVELLARLTRSGRPAELTIVTHRDTLLSDVLVRSSRLGVRHLVKVLPGLPAAGIADLMRESHLLVQPSQTEALSTVVSEAALSGLPVLAFNVGGMSEQVPPGTTLPAPDDVDAWLELGLSAPLRYAEDRRAALAHVPVTVGQFSVEAMVSAHADLYQETVERHP